MYAAYFDRITEDDCALIVVESLQRQFHISQTLLPENSVAGNWFCADIQDGEIISLRFDETKTANMKSEIETRMQRLQSKKKSRFKRR